MKELTEAIEKILETILRKTARGLSLIKLQGEASYRVYYRATLSSGESFIVMKMPAGKASASEEITNLKETSKEPPFLAVGRFLKSRGLPVPEIFHYDPENGLIVLEDFGDETFEKRISRTPPHEWEGWYRKAIDLLIEFQQKTAAAPADSIAHKRSFDLTLLTWEFDHFLEGGIEARLGKKIDPADASDIRRHMQAIVQSLLQAPQILVHRDFQSRNLMIHEGTLRLLDFQDALMGPLPYDLVALLRDSYIALPAETLQHLVASYNNSREFGRMFDLMTIQRKLKDAGRFVYIDRIKGNPSFLKHIPNSLLYVREAFERQADQKPLFELLQKYVPEFRS